MQSHCPPLQLKDNLVNEMELSHIVQILERATLGDGEKVARLQCFPLFFS